MILIILLAAVIVLWIFVDTSGSISEFFAPYLTEESDKATELYFTDYESMPKFVDVGKRYPIEFTIVNRERRDQRYTYRVTITENNETSVLTTDTVDIKDGEQAEEQIFFTTTKPGAKEKIVVELSNRSERITFSTQSNFQ